MTRDSSHSSLRPVTALILAALVAALVVGIAPTAGAASFSNSTSINTTDPVDCTSPRLASTPYPSNIVVSGLSGTVSDVNVTLNGLTNDWAADLEVMLVGPAGGAQNLVLLSDAGTSINGFNLTLDDSAANFLPQNGALFSPAKPTDYAQLNETDSFPAPAPAVANRPGGVVGNNPPGAGTATLASVFNGIVPNGTWSLYVVTDDCTDPAEKLSGGWSLDITTAVGAATTTTVVGSPNPSTTGSNVTFTATVTSGGSPVTTGTVTFTEGATVLAANVALNGSGQASFNKSNFAEGNHIVTATYNGVASFNTSNGSVNQRVNNVTTVTGTSYCNTGAITVNAASAATPYPSNIFVTGAPTQVVKVTATLKNVTHQFPDDMDVLLVGPTAQNLVLVSDAGLGSGPTFGANNVTAVFDDAAAGQLAQGTPWGAPGSTVFSKPVNYTTAPGDAYAAPAPAPSAATALSVYNGTNPNGTWSLYVMSDGAPDTGTIAGGWCLNFTFDTTPPTVTIEQAAGQAGATNTAPINFTATFSEPVSGFIGTDVSFAGSTAGGTLSAAVTGGPSIYNVAVTGMTTTGNVVASIPAGVAVDGSGNPNVASTSVDHTVIWDVTLPTCTITGVFPGPPKTMNVNVQDVGSGIQAINVVTIVNGTISTNPSPIPPGTTPVVVTATKTDQSQPTSFSFNATDVAGNVKLCA